MNEAKKMIKQNFETSKKLNEKNDLIYTDIVVYLRTSKLEEKQTEEIIADILDMFLRSQEEGKEIKEVIGYDYKAFCDSIIESAAKNSFSLNKILENGTIFLEGIFIMFTIDLAFNYFPKFFMHRATEYYTLKLSFVLITALIIFMSFGIVFYIGKTSFKKSKPSKLKNFLFGACYAIICLALGFASVKLSNYNLFSVHFYFVLVPVLIYWVYKLVISKLMLRAKK